MADVHLPEVRSYNMSKIGGKDTKPELIVRKYLHSQRFRYGLHNKKLPGKPDLVLRRYNTVIFIHGCFWHGHTGCRFFVVPKTRTAWWIDKIMKNKSNDKRNEKLLKKKGWTVITIWECQLRPGKRERTLLGLLKKLSKILDT